MILYTSDTHLGHAKVLQFARRPFASVEEMDAVLLRNLRDAEDTGATIVHCGDVCFSLMKWSAANGPIFRSNKRKFLVAGNHDQLKGKRRLIYEQSFDSITGTEGSWESHALVLEDTLDGRTVQVIVSHAPLENLWGCDVNVHGHLHNDILIGAHRPGHEWSYDSPVHFNVGVELHGFKPVTLQQAADAHRRRYEEARQWLATSEAISEDATPHA